MGWLRSIGRTVASWVKPVGRFIHNGATTVANRANSIARTIKGVGRFASDELPGIGDLVMESPIGRAFNLAGKIAKNVGRAAQGVADITAVFGNPDSGSGMQPGSSYKNPVEINSGQPYVGNIVVPGGSGVSTL